MRVFELANPSDLSVRSKFMIEGGGLPLFDFPKMVESLLFANNLGDYTISNFRFSPNYVRVGNSLFRVVCAVLGDENDIYITKETGQIIDFVQNDSLNFINITQIQQVSAKMGIALKN